MAAAQNTSVEAIRWPRIFGLLLLLLASAELLAWTFTWVWAGQPFGSFQKYEWSPYGLVRNNPALTMPGYHINRDGFRNIEEFEKRKPEKTLRVVTMGGSVLYAGLAGTYIIGAERVDSDGTIAPFLAEQLRADPEVAGLEVEVMNASVNFNRINEVATGYIAEYAHWEPDVVMVFGSANNFPVRAWKDQVYERTFVVQNAHPWRLEFERQVNRRTFFAALEHIVLWLEHELALVAWLKKVSTSVIDKVFGLAHKKSPARKPKPKREPASWAEWDAHIAEYLGYLDAIVAVARQHGQTPAVFWEYFVEHLEGIKPLSEREKELYDRILRKTWEVDKAFNFYARDAVKAWCEKREVPFIDPLEALRSEKETVFIDYLHYTREGNAIMAKISYEQMKAVFQEVARGIRAQK